jgi:hypothetical protein
VYQNQSTARLLSDIAIFAVAVAGWDEEYTGPMGRLQYYSDCYALCSGGYDVLITRCYFRDISWNSDGGAVYVYTFGEFRVEYSLFLGCWSQGCGGAIWADVKWVNLLNSCVVSCSSGSDGSVLWCDPDSGNSDCYDDSFVSTFSNGVGSVFATGDVNLRFSRVSFTSCNAVSRGSALATRNSSLTFTADHLILLALSGLTGIDSRCGSVLGISQSNFYENSMSEGGAVLWGNSCGFSLSECIFWDNAGNRLIGLNNAPSASNRFAFTKCVFSGDSPTNTALCIIESDCYSNTATASHIFHGVDGFAECPTSSPTATMSPRRTLSGTPSLQFGPSPPLQSTASHPRTRAFPFSGIFSPTRALWRSPDLAAITASFADSPELAPSHPFLISSILHSDEITHSPDLLRLFGPIRRDRELPAVISVNSPRKCS